MSPVHVVLRPAKPSGDPSPLRSLLDLVVDGVNITARAGETQGLTLLAELAHAVAALRRGRTPRATTQLCSAGDTWELGLEADGPDVLLSVIEVAPAQRSPCTSAGSPSSISARRSSWRSKPVCLLICRRGHRSVLEAAQAQLVRGDQAAKPLARGLVQDRIAVQSGGRLELRADCKFRVGGSPGVPADARIERSDLHGLLIPGDFRLSMGRRSIALVGTQLFLLSERLLWLAEDALDSWQSARPLFRRVELEGVRLGVRRGPGDAPLALTIAILPGEGDRPKQLTLSDIDTTDFVEAATHFAESLGERFVLHDRRRSKTCA